MLNEDPDPEAPALESTALPLPAVPPLYCGPLLDVWELAAGATVDAACIAEEIVPAVVSTPLALVAKVLCSAVDVAAPSPVTCLFCPLTERLVGAADGTVTYSVTVAICASTGAAKREANSIDMACMLTTRSALAVSKRMSSRLARTHGV